MRSCVTYGQSFVFFFTLLRLLAFQNRTIHGFLSVTFDINSLAKTSPHFWEEHLKHSKCVCQVWDQYARKERRNGPAKLGHFTNVCKISHFCGAISSLFFGLSISNLYIASQVCWFQGALFRHVSICSITGPSQKFNKPWKGLLSWIVCISRNVTKRIESGMFFFWIHRQVDLVDMRKEAVSHNGQRFQYILTIQDVFRRYLWLRSLTYKSSNVVSKALDDLYTDVGPPKVLQSDRGGEFKKWVKKLRKSLNVKVIWSKPYHPQSQGKVERSHRALRKKKNAFDLGHLSKSGVHWAKHVQLRECQKLQIRIN